MGSRPGCRSFHLLEVLTVCCGGSRLLLSSCSLWNTFRKLSFVSCIFCFVYGTWNEITTICGEHFHVYKTSSHPLFHLAHLISLWGWWVRELCHCMPCNGKQGNRPSKFQWSSQGPIAWKWWHWRSIQHESPGYKFRALSTLPSSPWKSREPLVSFILTISSILLCRGVYLELRWQHVHEDHHAHGHAHRGRGCLLPLHVPASLWAAGGYYLQGLCGHPAFGAGWGACQAHG